ncbi:MAG TPA: cytochrome c oxidase assembly protein [Limnochordales bacterium]
MPSRLSRVRRVLLGGAGLAAWALAWPGRSLAHGGHEHIQQPLLSLTDWQWDPLVLLAVGAGALLAAKARPWADAPRRLRQWWWAGLALVAVAVESPLDRGADRYLFFLHMVQHMLLSMAAAPLLALGMPAAAWRWLQQRPGVGALVGWLSWLPVATGLYNAALVAWHLPGPYEAALAHDAVHALQHGMFVGTGFLFWAAVLTPERLGRPAGAGMRAAALVASAVVNWLVSFALVGAGRMIYPTYASAPRLWGLSPEADMALGAGVMWEHGNMVYALALLRLIRSEWLRPAASAEGQAWQPAAGDAR